MTVVLSFSLPLAAELHLLDAVELHRVDLRLVDQGVIAFLEGDEIGLRAFEVHVQITEGATRVAERCEIVERADCRKRWGHRNC